jgi:hypothetical protein
MHLEFGFSRDSDLFEGTLPAGFVFITIFKVDVIIYRRPALCLKRDSMKNALGCEKVGKVLSLTVNLIPHGEVVAVECQGGRRQKMWTRLLT